MSPLIFDLVMDAILNLFDYDLGDLPIVDGKGKAILSVNRKQRHRPVKRGKVYTSGFADDTCFYVSGKNLVEMQQKMQIVMDFAAQWAAEATMAFSHTKTKVIIFTKKRTFEHPPKLKLNGKELKYRSQVLYLGLWVDQKLSWRYHFNEKIKS